MKEKIKSMLDAMIAEDSEKAEELFREISASKTGGIINEKKMKKDEDEKEEMEDEKEEKEEVEDEDKEEPKKKMKKAKKEVEDENEEAYKEGTVNEFFSFSKVKVQYTNPKIAPKISEMESSELGALVRKANQNNDIKTIYIMKKDGKWEEYWTSDKK